ncbi:SDR family oxidoreductase [Rhodococcoides kroppenstedtii]|uniref:SDR family oxidoreductase n=1 Tax=Rhodococcoides kroppenstedtii TaxID=293050 RepID=UPI0028E214B1|nr:SDR family oxidoreductase [Rhodococcus kroppenstedtii]
MDTRGAVAVVTGGGNGIGRAISNALVEHGAYVVVSDIDAGAAAQTAERLGPNAVSISGDASTSEHVDAAVQLAERSFGAVDIYFANAGIGRGNGLDVDEVWAQALDVNLMAHVRAAQRLIPEWQARGRGYFFSTASAAGLLAQLGNAPYTVTKHAAVAFAEWLSITYGDDGVRVSCLCPMGVKTALLEGPDNPPLMRQAVESAGDVLTPEAVAALVLEAVAYEQFLVLPHPEVARMMQGKAADRDRWLDGMRRYRSSLAG